MSIVVIRVALNIKKSPPVLVDRITGLRWVPDADAPKGMCEMKSFSINKYGDEGAYAMAVEYCLNILKEMKAQGWKEEYLQGFVAIKR